MPTISTFYEIIIAMYLKDKEELLKMWETGVYMKLKGLEQYVHARNKS